MNRSKILRVRDRNKKKKNNNNIKIRKKNIRVENEERIKERGNTCLSVRLASEGIEAKYLIQ